MDVQNIQYYLYEDEPNATDMVVVEENKILKQLQEAVVSNKDDHSEDEITAAIGLMLLHYQAINKPELTPNKDFDTPDEQEDRTHSESKIMENVVPTPTSRLDAIRQQVRRNRGNNYNRTILLASCRNILKEFLSQNGL